MAASNAEETQPRDVRGGRGHTLTQAEAWKSDTATASAAGDSPRLERRRALGKRGARPLCLLLLALMCCRCGACVLLLFSLFLQRSSSSDAASALDSSLAESLADSALPPSSSTLALVRYR